MNTHFLSFHSCCMFIVFKIKVWITWSKTKGLPSEGRENKTPYVNSFCIFLGIFFNLCDPYGHFEYNNLVQRILTVNVISFNNKFVSIMFSSPNTTSKKHPRLFYSEKHDSSHHLNIHTECTVPYCVPVKNSISSTSHTFLLHTIQ